jgi:predicted transglutaminase-like cysteine proteinase
MRAQGFLGRLCAGLAILAVLPLPAQADLSGLARIAPEIEPSAHITANRTTLAPFSYIRFCQRQPGECRGGVEATIAWDLHARMRLARINRRVNRLMLPQHDKADVWSVGMAAGDCEDFALTKRHLLIRAGFPAASLQMAVTRIRSGEGHAVLVVRTSRGDLVLDSRNDRLTEWHRTDLTWLKIASSENPRLWYAMN